MVFDTACNSVRGVRTVWPRDKLEFMRRFTSSDTLLTSVTWPFTGAKSAPEDHNEHSQKRLSRGNRFPVRSNEKPRRRLEVIATCCSLALFATTGKNAIDFPRGISSFLFTSFFFIACFFVESLEIESAEIIGVSLETVTSLGSVNV